MSGNEHAVCRMERTPCGPHCDFAIELRNEETRRRIESASGPLSVVVENPDGSFTITPKMAGVLPQGNIHRIRAAATSPSTQAGNRRARRAQAARARHG